ncbi:endopeptidase La [Haliscomenobacter sp.]|uniref:endopeptidase La n=1 Tax=Haliscomenobacter sp. TaxID=2717303 RepID=UPI0033652549
MFDALLVNRELDDDSDFLPMLSMDEGQDTIADDQYPGFLPILALKNTVLFPGVVIPITVGRDKSIRAINEAYESAKLIGVLSQRDVKVENPGAEDLYQIGTVAQIIKILRMPDGTTTAILRGQKRFELGDMLRESPFMEGSIRILPHPEDIDTLEFEAQISTIMDLSHRIVELSPNIPQEAIAMLRSIQDNSFLLNFISSNMNSKVEVKQQILEYNDLSQKASLVIHEMGTQLQLLELKDKIETRVRGDLEKQQRDYFLSQQLKTIQEELGQNPQEEDVNSLEAKGKAKQWSESAAKHFEKELTKLRRMNPQVAEYSIQLNYLELMIDLPWQQYSEDNFNLKRVKKVLDHDHFGLEKVKERILEHLAVLKLKGDMKAPILCLVGPPGVGKTSLGRSIATALDREFVQMSLGGLHDESEVRGHRKTYIGALPGRIIQSMKKAGSGNPVFLLDEIDKVGRDFRGDPSSALLEVLDPSQNDHFHDNYLEVDYDLSKVLFIATANGLSTIQPPLLDRMEIIEISGYSMEEKVEIAKRHLIPEQLKEHGLKASQVKFGKKALKKIVQEYTRESGVRSLNRQIAAIMRHVAKEVAMDETSNPNIDETEVASILGIKPYTSELYKEVPSPGVAVGLAWTQMGGEILFVESSVSKGTGRMILTGNLGEVMKESATTAMSFIKAHAEELGVDTEKIEKSDVHVHIPEGAIPKDGPSAGVTMLTALASIFTGKPVKPFLAMTGEITLRGKVLPVGGIKEKILAAKRAGMKEIILCKENRRHVEDINTDYISGLKFHYVGNMQEVLAQAIA